MIKIELDQEEEQVLLETLQSYLSDLRYEIAAEQAGTGCLAILFLNSTFRTGLSCP